MSIALAAASIFFLGVFLAFSLSMYFKREKEHYDFRNHFCFEILPDKHDPNFMISIIAPTVFLLSVVANFIYFAISDFGVMNVVIAFISLLLAFSIGVLFILPLSKLKERSIFSIMLIVLVAAINALLFYEETFYIKAYQDNLIYLPIIINGLLLIVAVIVIFFPRLFDLGVDKDESGVSIRKKMYPLAFLEWILILSFPLTQISIIVMEIIKK